MTIGSTVRRRRKELGLTQAIVAKDVSISKPYLSNIESETGRSSPSDQVLRRLERALNFRPGELVRLVHLARTPADVRDELELRGAQIHKLRGAVRGLLADGAPVHDVDELLAGGNVEPVSLGRPMPVINSVAAGYPQEFTDLDYPPSVADDYVRCPGVNDSQAFAARVVGDSMEPGYLEGDLVVFSPNTPVENGNDCFVRFDHDAGTTFKRYYQDDAHTIRLQPLNSRYPSQTYPAKLVTGLWPAILRIQELR